LSRQGTLTKIIVTGIISLAMDNCGKFGEISKSKIIRAIGISQK